MTESEPIYEYDAAVAQQGFWSAVMRQVRALAAGRDQMAMLVVARYTATYARTLLGQLWWYLDPVLAMAVYSFLVVVVLQAGDVQRADGRHVPYTVFVFCALMPWKWFTNSTTRCCTAIIDGAGLLAKVRIHALVFVALHVKQELRHFLVGLLLVVGLAGWHGIWPEPLWMGLALLLPITVQLILHAALGTLLSVACAYFRDLVHVVPVTLNLLFFVTPVLYASGQVPAQYRPLVELNPLGVLTESYRAILLDGQLPPLGPLAAVLAGSLVLLAVALRVFDRYEGDLPKIL